MLARATVLPSSDGDIVLLVLGDITSLKRVERELRILTRAIEQSESSVLITDRTGRIEYVNPTLLAASGYRRDEVIGQNPRVRQVLDDASPAPRVAGAAMNRRQAR